jgi:choline dehydrogenase-like flavoprotein
MIKRVSAGERCSDVCVVGTGPVGMALALALEKRGCGVLVLEAGNLDGKASDASRAEIVDPARHAPMELAVCRALGGTSWTWGSRCVPYDSVDWLPRDFVPEARWPIDEEAVRPWFEEAAEVLLCGSGKFDLPYDHELSPDLTLRSVERWARQSQTILAHRDHLIACPRIRLSLDTTVTGIRLNADGRAVESLTVTTPSGPCEVKARRFVLAMGGVETTRLLLHLQRTRPRLFHGEEGAVGRYYMGHISGKIANIIFLRPADSANLDFKLDGNAGAFYRRRFRITDEAQTRHRVLNTAFWPDNPAFYDPRHGSPVLSAVFLALAFPPTGRRLLPEAIRLTHTGPRPYPLAAHLKNAVLGAPLGAADMYLILRDRFLRKPRKPGFLVHTRSGLYALHYHAEHAPTRESRITLSQDRDSFGVPRARIDLRFSDQDVDSVIQSHRVLDQALRSCGLARLEFMYPEHALKERVYAQASDGYHQVGTTRMGWDDRTSVVDSDLRVHGIGNLFVASSSVFPSSGQANSTFLAVVFALRLADLLRAQDAGVSGPTLSTALA